MSTMPDSANEARASSTNAIDHEEKQKPFAHYRTQGWVQENITVTTPSDRSVMWADPAVAGPRSGGTAPQAGPASGVTRGSPAEPGEIRGAALAGHDKAEQAKPAGSNVIEDHNVDEAVFAFEAAASTQGFAGEGFVDEGEVKGLFGTVKKARALIQEIKADRALRKICEPSAGAIADYRGRVRVLDDLAQSSAGGKGPTPLCGALLTYAGRTSSFDKMRAVAMWRARAEVERLLALQDALQRKQPRSDVWAHEIGHLDRALVQLEAIKRFTLVEARKVYEGEKKASRSKRNVLKHLKPGWRESLLADVVRSRKYRCATVLQMLAGMRPEELQQGVLVRRRGPMVGIRIKGAKVREHAGQPWRALFIPADRFPPWFLEEIDKEARVFSAPKDAMRMYLNRRTFSVFPRKKQGEQPQLSAYVMRHALATDLWDAGWDEEGITQALGEVAVETSRWYGLRRKPHRSRRKPDVGIQREHVQTARPVKRKVRKGVESSSAVTARMIRP